MYKDEAQQQLQNLDEHIEARAQAIRAARNWWPCRRGCDQCCRQLALPPELSSSEWVRVDEAVAALPERVRDQIEQKIDALLMQIAAKTVSSQVICPYLDEQERVCSIYYSRPIACRTYGFFVTRTQEQYCQLVETEVALHRDSTIVWGNAEVIHNEVERIGGVSVPFHVHYCSRTWNKNEDFGNW